LQSSSSSSRRNNNASDTGGYRSLSQQQQQQQQQLQLLLHDDDDDEKPTFSFPNHRPILAIITEQDACQTDEKMERTFNAIRQAVSTNQVDLVSIRLSFPSAPLVVVAVVENEESKKNDDEDELVLFNQRACTLTKKLVQLSEQQQQQHIQHIEDEERQDNNTTSNSSSSSSSTSFRVVCSSNLVSVAVRGRAHGVHVKEHHLDQIPSIIDQFDYPIIIGTSAHSIKSALESYSVDEEKTTTTTTGAIRPHYYFVGTCYTTASHPEKTNSDQLEGPELPGQIKQALSSTSSSSSSSSLLPLPRILAIGGIDETNCHEPVAFGADGVAVIRAVLQADHPANIVEQMQSNMMITMMVNDNLKQ